MTTCPDCGRELGAYERTKKICWGCIERFHHRNCPRCREKDAEIERLRQACQQAEKILRTASDADLAQAVLARVLNRKD